MYSLDFALFFGVPNNKLELIDNTSRWAFPFASREEGEAHFHAWLESFRRWKQVDTKTPIRKSTKCWKAEVNGIRMELFPRPIDMRLPIAYQAFDAIHKTFNRRDYWPGQPKGLETGWDSVWDEGDVRMNLWSLFRRLSDQYGGEHSSRCEIAISDSAAVAPDAYYYREGRKNIMIEGGDYFGAAPDLVAEVLSAPSRRLDRGPRMEVCRKAGVPHLWLIEPATETIEVFELHAQYELCGRFQAGDMFPIDLFPGELVRVDELFDTKSKRWNKEKPEELPPIPEWILPPEFKVGLEYFFGLGHPERRWEFWNNKAQSVLAFGSVKEAAARFDYFLAEACNWEGRQKPKSTSGGDRDQAEIGRFQLRREGRLVYLDIPVDGRRHREFLTLWSSREAWDWGDEKS
jgi:Uma2 family endonuclease